MGHLKSSRVVGHFGQSLYLMKKFILFGSIKKILNTSGALLIKTFSNQNLKKLKKLFKENFEKVVLEKPPASKTSSAEVYLLGLVPK